nr:MAG TPA: hypothetical protein [Caudoviricetes sp.]DAV47554.1 MAG TPA: hypothetical protein [Caudoviricetes sp.]
MNKSLNSIHIGFVYNYYLKSIKEEIKDYDWYKNHS